MRGRERRKETWAASTDMRLYFRLSLKKSCRFCMFYFSCIYPNPVIALSTVAVQTHIHSCYILDKEKKGSTTYSKQEDFIIT